MPVGGAPLPNVWLMVVLLLLLVIGVPIGLLIGAFIYFL